jgi:hypothetical protein
MDALVLEQFAQQPQRCAGIAAFLNQNVQHFAFVINGSPKPHPFAANLHNHFVQMPAARWLGPGSPQILSEVATKFQTPTSDGLVANVDPALGQHLLDIAKAQGEPEIKPNRLADDVRRKPVPFEAD